MNNEITSTDVIKDDHSKFLMVIVWVLILFILILILNAWRPWMRDATVFYEPFYPNYPVQVVKGDIIIAENKSRIVIDHDGTVNYFYEDSKGYIFKYTKRVSLWDKLRGITEESFTYNSSCQPFRMEIRWGNRIND